MALATSLLVGCGSGAQPEVRQNVVEPGRLDATAEAERLLARDAVDEQRFARSTLYSWTTTEQIDELRQNRRLLARDESPASGASFVDQILFALAQKDPLARLLFTTPFARMRFAWPTPWSTRAGWPNEKYGSQLIRIALRSDAWIVRLTTATGTFEVHDLHDDVVPIATVLVAPHRIAAIYFVSDASVAPADGLPKPGASFREYVLCNESMIESYEVGTARIAHEIAESAALIDTLIKAIKTTPPRLTHSVPTAWRRPQKGLVASYYAALALDSSLYELTEELLVPLATALRATPKPPAIEQVPALAFAKGVARNPPRMLPRSVDVSFARPVSPTAARP